MSPRRPRRSARPSWSTVAYVASVIGAIAVGGIIFGMAVGWWNDAPLNPGPMGWAGPDIAAAESAVVEQMTPAFGIVGDQEDHTNDRVVLHDLARWQWGGDVPWYPQEIGDCVGFGAATACRYCAVATEWRTGKKQARDFFIPFHWANSRNQPSPCGAGRLRGSDGSVGSWQAWACQKYGVIPADLPGLPKYSKSVAMQWRDRIPEERFLAEGRQRLVKTVSLVKDAASARDALCNYYCISVASDYTWVQPIRVREGRLVAVNRTARTPVKQRFWHQMALIGYDGSPETRAKFGQAMFLMQNQHRDETARDERGNPINPPDGSPRGSFWITEADAAYILTHKDSWVYSDLDGFPARKADVVAGMAKERKPGGAVAAGAWAIAP